MYFDSHAHLDDPRFEQDFAEILARMRENGVTGMMNIGCDLPSSERSVELAGRFDWVWAAVGSHPDDADHVDAARIERYRALCRHPRVKAVGEIGLDYHYEDVPRDVQKQAFRMQMQLAREVDLPVVVHEREAHGDAMELLDDFPDVTGVFHCYSGSAEMARELLRRGWYLGFDGPVTYKNARKTLEVLEICPLDRILIETDSPYLTPVPKRGKRNNSGNLCYIADKIAEVKGLSPEEIARITMENGRRLFGV